MWKKLSFFSCPFNSKGTAVPITEGGAFAFASPMVIASTKGGGEGGGFHRR